VTWDTNTNQHETWALDVAKLKWTRMSPKTEASPSMSRSRNLDYVPQYNLFILETSSKEGKGKSPEIWTYRYAPAPPEDRPAPPVNVRVVTDRGKATVTWDPSAGKVPAQEYRVYRAAAEEPWKTDFQKVAAVKGTTYDDSGLAVGQTYFYTVRAVGKGGVESRPSFSVRTQPRVLLKPVVSVLDAGKVEVAWNRHPAADVIGYNVYRGTAVMRSVKKGAPKAWSDNDPEYDEPTPVEVRDIIELEKLNAAPVTGTVFTDAKADLTARERGPLDGKWTVRAYIIKAVNKLGTESGPSPYALTFPAAPENVLLREDGEQAEIKWSPSPEKGVAGYHIYKLGKGHWEVVRVTKEPVRGTTLTHQGGRGTTRYWVVAVDALGQEGEPSSPVWFRQSYKGFFQGEWHQ
jgi:fibronectin type 3 domain-containing protein